jgi:hypothetical protein
VLRQDTKEKNYFYKYRWRFFSAITVSTVFGGGLGAALLWGGVVSAFVLPPFGALTYLAVIGIGAGIFFAASMVITSLAYFFGRSNQANVPSQEPAEVIQAVEPEVAPILELPSTLEIKEEQKWEVPIARDDVLEEKIHLIENRLTEIKNSILTNFADVSRFNSIMEKLRMPTALNGLGIRLLDAAVTNYAVDAATKMLLEKKNILVSKSNNSNLTREMKNELIKNINQSHKELDAHIQGWIQNNLYQAMEQQVDQWFQQQDDQLVKTIAKMQPLLLLIERLEKSVTDAYAVSQLDGFRDGIGLKAHVALQFKYEEQQKLVLQELHRAIARTEMSQLQTFLEARQAEEDERAEEFNGQIMLDILSMMRGVDDENTNEVDVNSGVTTFGVFGSSNQQQISHVNSHASKQKSMSSDDSDDEFRDVLSSDEDEEIGGPSF